MILDIVLILLVVVFAVAVWGLVFLGTMLIMYRIFNSPMFIKDRKRCDHDDI